MLLSGSLSIGLHGAVPVGAYEPEAQALFARFTSSPTAARRRLINALIRSLKLGGIWSRLDALYLLAAADSQAARQNWVADRFNLVAVGAPVFTADRGYAGDGVGAHLDTGFNPVAAAALSSQNDIHLATWVNTNIAEDKVDAGNPTSILNSRNAAGSFQGRAGSVSTSAVAVAASTGHSVATRSGPAQQDLYRNGELVQSDPHASAPLASGNYLVLGRSGASFFTSRRLAVCHIGASINSAQAAATHLALSAYLTAIGGN